MRGIRTLRPDRHRRSERRTASRGRPSTVNDQGRRDRCPAWEIPASLMKEVVHREFRGGSQGVSVPLGKGFRYRVGGFRGRSVVTGTSIEPADNGLLSITSQRTVFQGSRKTQECRYDKLVGRDTYTDALQLNVSNRQTPSMYGVQDGLGPVAAAINQRGRQSTSRPTERGNPRAGEIFAQRGRRVRKKSALKTAPTSPGAAGPELRPSLLSRTRAVIVALSTVLEQGCRGRALTPSPFLRGERG